MKVLLVYPRYPDTFWNFRHVLKFIAKKAAFPPLGLLTVAALLPSEWEKRLVDMNTDRLEESDLSWADCVFISAMDIQRDSVREVIARCRALGKKTVAGGPLFTIAFDEFEGVDHFVLGEAEGILPEFLRDLDAGTARSIYRADERPDVRTSPPPAWGLINPKKYVSLSVQYSRGCPHDCEFCDIVLLNGRAPRTKDTSQVIAELQAIYSLGWRDSVMIVDDNFIGNRKKLKQDTLPAMVAWAKEHGYPFSLLTQASVALADDPILMDLMVSMGFDTVFIGIETPNEESLGECGKHQNTNRDLLGSIKAMQNHGLQVYGGFIVGFDNDPKNIFERQIEFIQKSGIVGAMVGLLKAPKGTKLYARLKKEDRITNEWSGDAVDLSTNFKTRMNRDALIAGYKHILSVTYTPKQYYARIRLLLKELKPSLRPRRTRVTKADLGALCRTVWYIGIKEKGQHHFWGLIVSTLFRRPKSLPLAVRLAICGYHFRKVTEGFRRKAVQVPLQP